MIRSEGFSRGVVLTGAAALFICGLLSGGGVLAMDGGRTAFKELSLSAVSIRGGFWGARQDLVWKTTLPSQWEQFEAHHHLDNFRVAAGKKEGVHLGPVYLDSDLYKWLEASSYVIGRHPDDSVLSGRLDEVVGLIRAARMPDGYINTYYECFAPDRRFTNLLMNHELYCAGHLMEAACANFQATGNPALLEAATGFASMIGSVFGPGRNEGVPGHEEIELALIKLVHPVKE